MGDSNNKLDVVCNYNDNLVSLEKRNNVYHNSFLASSVVLALSAGVTAFGFASHNELLTYNGLIGASVSVASAIAFKFAEYFNDIELSKIKLERQEKLRTLIKNLERWDEELENEEPNNGDKSGIDLSNIRTIIFDL